MAKKRTTADLVRLALHYAIEERESFIACTEGYTTTDADVAALDRAKALVAEWRTFLAKRYGQRPMGDRMPLGKTVPLIEVLGREPQEFSATLKPLRL